MVVYMTSDPREYRLSKHFVLSDFLGNHSVYTKGYANMLDFVKDDIRLENAKCLCEEGLEPLLEAFGPISISYGFISPEVSDRVVRYQDPRKPSHHLWNLGAAADILCHRWIAGEPQTAVDLYFPESARQSPIALAHAIDYLDIPYSRLITYSESPYICLALSAQEYVAGTPRRAFYENKFMGRPKEKPAYRSYSTSTARQRALEELQQKGLPDGWEGGGWPSYHGGGFRQLHHNRVSKYTMLSDWLFDLKSISNGAKNVPAMNLEAVQDAFAAVGIVYDWTLESLGVKRLSITSGYVSHTNPYFKITNDWRESRINFSVNLPDDNNPDWAVEHLKAPNGVFFTSDGDFLTANIDVDMVLEEPEESWHVN